MHLSASLPIAIVLMLKRSCLLAYVGNRCLRGANGELMRRVFHRTCSFSDVCFLDQSLGFPDCWISLNRSLIFRLRSASSSYF